MNEELANTLPHSSSLWGEARRGVAINLGNIGSLYLKAPSLPPPLGEEKKGYALAEEYLKNSLALYKEIGGLDGTRDKDFAT